MEYRFNPDQSFFDRIFPFSFIFDEKMQTIQAGRSILKLFPEILNGSFHNFFTIERPRSAGTDLKNILLFTDQIFLVRGNTGKKEILLRGEMCPLEGGRMGFFCSPWLTSSDDLEKLDLNILDYALHDSVTDLLQLIKVKDITTNDIRQLNDRLKTTELRLSNLISTMNTGILLENESRQIVLSNQYFCNIFNILVPPEQLRGMDCSQSAEQSKGLFTNPDKFVDRVNELVNNRELCTGEELIMRDGRYLERDFIPIFQDKNYLGHLWNYRDVTDKKKSRAELVIARKEAEAGREAEKEFIAHMSHEIRTPLNSIIGMSHLLLDTDLTPAQKEFLEIQKSSTEILYSLINDILDISKMESGSIDLSVEKVDLGDILRKQHQTFVHQVGGKPVKIDVQIDPSFDEYFLGDKILLNQILFNLLGNAVKFTEEGRIELRGKVVEESGPMRTICISVEDTGIGIPANKQKAIFEKFKQADSDVSVHYGGTGLGLAITKSIVDLLGGTIAVNSTPGKGSTFRVFLPMIGTQERIKDKQAISRSGEPIQDLKDMNFLVAEDNEMNTYYISRIMDKAGAKVKYARNGGEACAMAEKQEFDLIFMDIRMPIMNGLEAMREIRSGQGSNKNTPILALTASAHKHQVSEARNAGCTGFLAKPFTPDELLKKISELTVMKTGNPGSAPEIPKGHNDDRLTFIDELYGGEVDMAREMIDIFYSENYPLFEKLGVMLEKRELQDAREIVHKIKPSFAMIGLPGIHHRMNELEIGCDEERPLLVNLYQDIKKELVKALPEIDALLASSE